MQTQSAVDDLLQNVGDEIKELKSQVIDSIDSGEVRNADEWIGIINSLIRELDHVVEKLETIEK